LFGGVQGKAERKPIAIENRGLLEASSRTQIEKGVKDHEYKIISSGVHPARLVEKKKLAKKVIKHAKR